MQVIQRRSGLERLRKAIVRGSVTLGFIGGSITEQRPGHNWPEYIVPWFNQQYPGLRIQVENAAIGATGSELAVFRAKRDLIDRGADLVFIEYAVNDWDQLTQKRMNTREGLIRKLLKEERDIVLVYTYSQPMYETMIKDQVPDSISEFETLADHYQIGSVWMGLHALNEVKSGWMKWEEWLPDGLHPGHRGSYCYARSVIKYLEAELIEEPNNRGIPCQEDLPQALNPHNWENTSILPFDEVCLKGPWYIRRYSAMPWVDQVLETAAIGAELSFKFKGRGISLGFDFGIYASDYRYRIDGGEWIDMVRARPDWCPDSGWYLISTLEDDLEYGEHEVELSVTHGNSDVCKGSNFRLAMIGYIE